ncbi:MAG: 30S ribosomal protein S2, partial [Sedimentisphaerales bacterium]|nr:30S ribosomal protein S2 [Sedimentisphaerales bacterium]
RRSSIHIIDVRQTLKGIILAKKLISDVVSKGKDVVFVGTKRQAHKPVKAAAEAAGMHYITTRWLGGSLTNFRTIHSRIQRLEELESMLEDGSIESESKKRASTLKRELRKIKANLEGIRNLKNIPGVIVAVDARKESLALREARKMGVPTIAIIDTDSDPDLVDLAIPANDDSVKAIELITNELVAAVVEGKTMYKAIAKEAEPVRKPRLKRRSIARATGNDDRDSQSAATSQAVAQAEPPAQTESDQAPQAAN